MNGDGRDMAGDEIYRMGWRVDDIHNDNRRLGVFHGGGGGPGKVLRNGRREVVGGGAKGKREQPREKIPPAKSHS